MNQEQADFRDQTHLEELVRGQQVTPVIRLEDILGKGAHLWESDEQFQQFLVGITERRHGVSGS